MTSDSSHIAWFAEVGRDDVSLVGGKGANLGELTQADIPVPRASSSRLGRIGSSSITAGSITSCVASSMD